MSNMAISLAVTRACFEAGSKLGLSDDDLAEALQVDPGELSVIRENGIDLLSSQWSTALHIIGVYQGLSRLNGDDSDAIQHFLNTFNATLNLTPIQAMKSPQGLAKIKNFIDLLRKV